MAGSTPYNMVKQTVSGTPGTGTISLSTAVAGFGTFANAGVPTGTTVTARLSEGDDWEIFQGVYSSGSPPTLTRATVRLAKDGSTFNTTKQSFTSAAIVELVECAEDIIGPHTIWIPASAMTLPTTAPPTRATYESTTNDRAFERLAFDDTSDKHAHFSVMLPPSWNLGTLTFKAVWMTTATDTDSVTWAIEATSIADGESIDTAWGTAATISDAAQSSATEQLISGVSGALTIAGSPAAGELAYFRVYNDVSVSSITEATQLVGIQLTFNTAAATDG